MQILKNEKIDGNIYWAAKRMHKLAQERNVKIVFHDASFGDRFAFLVGPKDSLEKIQKTMLKHLQSYFDVKEWDAYRKAIKLMNDLDTAFLKEENILHWLNEFIPLTQMQYVQNALNIGSLQPMFMQYHDSHFINGTINTNSPLYLIICKVIDDLTLHLPIRMEICDLIKTEQLRTNAS